MVHEIVAALSGVSTKMMVMQFMNETKHRPYPLPRASYVISQVWKDLLFAHWRIEPQRLSRLIPEPLEVDTFDGAAWIGVVPFRMCNVRPRYAPEVGPISNFLELNVRTYVTYKGIKAVYFFSLDASNAVAVFIARNVYKLPYYLARMTFAATSDPPWITYTCDRSGHKSSPVLFEGKYRPCSQAETSSPGSLAEFLTERYCLMLVSGGNVIKTDIHHAPWQLCQAEAEIKSNSMSLPLGIQLNGPPDALHFSSCMEMVNWNPNQI